MFQNKLIIRWTWSSQRPILNHHAYWLFHKVPALHLSKKSQLGWHIINVFRLPYCSVLVLYDVAWKCLYLYKSMLCRRYFNSVFAMMVNKIAYSKPKTSCTEAPLLRVDWYAWTIKLTSIIDNCNSINWHFEKCV